MRLDGNTLPLLPWLLVAALLAYDGARAGWRRVVRAARWYERTWLPKGRHQPGIGLAEVDERIVTR
jgi:hypothetical protein